jgi:radical SAM protein with 4Fe4S-binding SPASM domain
MLQINTTLGRHNLRDLAAIADLVEALDARRWTVFLLVPTGRASAADAIDSAQCEIAFEWLAERARRAPFRIKTTEAPHYRRVVLQAEAGEGAGAWAGARTAPGRFVAGMNDGSGFLFVSHTGEIQPSGFLPLTAGNVRTASLVETYRTHPLFTALRNPDLLKGRCGRCEFRFLCGGSRARAYAATGDFLAEDPACAYEPGWPAPGLREANPKEESWKSRR